MNLPIISVAQLSISTPSKVLFSNITFDVSRGELLAIMGPSGIGKSMLSRAIAGFTADSIQIKGHITLSGCDVSNIPLLHRSAAQRPAFIFQDALQALNPLVSIERQLSLALTSSQTKPNKIEKKTITDLLKKLEFSEPDLILTLYPGQLSGGQRQRICIAIGLLSKAEVLIADEPTSALDPITEKEILTLIRKNIKQKQLAGILITHNLNSALACDKLLIIDEGGMIAYGPPTEALKNSSHSFLLLIKRSYRMNDMTASIQFNNVSLYYYSLPRWLGGKPFKALHNINLCIEDKSLAIVGPSGSGKSTLIELLFGLRKATNGDIILFGNSLPINSPKAQANVCKHMQLIPQEPHTSLNPYYTVYQVLQEPLLNLNDKSNHEVKIKDALKNVGLSNKLLPLTADQLSTGQAQRVAIARALVVNPSVLIADEPTSSLDPISRQKILDLLLSLKSRLDMRLVLITHDLQAAQTLCDDILVLNHGEVAEFGPSNQIMTTPNHATTQALINAQSLIIPNQPHN